jgi:hypothetical protein
MTRFAKIIPCRIKHRRLRGPLAVLRVWPAIAIVLAAVLSTTVTLDAQEPQPAPSSPKLNIGAAEFPDQDAIILRWEQHWTLDQDGATRHRDHQWVKLLNHRAIGRFGDPRIDFCEGRDKLTVHTARTILPNGEVLPVPNYSYNLAAPEDVGGWPHYAGWQQQVICFSGIEDGCVIELDYEVASKPHMVPWLEADIRLHDEYPVVSRIVSVTVPEAVEVHSQINGIPQPPEVEKASTATAVTYQWIFGNLPAMPGEAQSPRWEHRCGRLRFTTCKSAADWVAAISKAAETAVKPDEKIKKFAESAIEQERDSLERIRKVTGKLRDAFSVVDSLKTYRPLACREAADILQADYGNPLEAAALCAAALQALGIQTSLELAVDGPAWDDAVPTLSTLAGAIVVVDMPSGPVRVHPQQGIIRNPGGWGRRLLLGLDKSGSLQKTYIRARGEKQSSEIDISGKIAIDGAGKASGDLLVRLTGLFYDPANLETTAAQEALMKNLAGRVLTGVPLKTHSISTLSEELLRAKVSIASTEALKSLDKRYALKLGEGPAFLPEVPLPLGRSSRRADVQLAGSFTEDVDLTLELPEGWTAEIVPSSLPEIKQSWGQARQEVSVDGRNVRFHRFISGTTDLIAAKDFAALREAVNALRAESSRILLIAPAKKDPDQQKDSAQRSRNETT